MIDDELYGTYILFEKFRGQVLLKYFNSVDGLCERMASEIILFGRDLVTRTLVWCHNCDQGVTRTALKWKWSSTLHQDIGRFETTVLPVHTRICTFYYDRLATDNLIFSQSRTNFVSWIVPHPSGSPRGAVRLRRQMRHYFIYLNPGLQSLDLTHVPER